MTSPSSSHAPHEHILDISLSSLLVFRCRCCCCSNRSNAFLAAISRGSFPTFAPTPPNFIPLNFLVSFMHSSSLKESYPSLSFPCVSPLPPPRRPRFHSLSHHCTTSLFSALKSALCSEMTLCANSCINTLLIDSYRLSPLQSSVRNLK